MRGLCGADVVLADAEGGNEGDWTCIATLSDLIQTGEVVEAQTRKALQFPAIVRLLPLPSARL